MKSKTEFYKPTENMDKQSDIRLVMAAEIWKWWRLMGREEKGGATDEEQRQVQRPSRDERQSREARR